MSCCLNLDGLCFAPEVVFDGVVAQFLADGTDVPNAFGWKYVARQKNVFCRIVWVPGDDEGASIGSIAPPSRPGNNPRSLANLEETFTVYLDAYDPRDAENERTQWRAARGLFNAWWRAVHNTYPGQVSIASARYVDNHRERRRGVLKRLLVVAKPEAENERQRRFLAEAGCTTGQGWLFAPAMSAASTAQWLARYQGMPMS